MLPSIPAGSIDLAYLDPPFFTRKVHRLSPRDGSREFTFSDLWASHEEYGSFLYDRLKELYRVLSSCGSIFFHCDRNASHISRAVLDEVFSADSFKSEIIWCYRRWSNSGNGLLPAHQTIYYYTKSNEYTFNVIREDYSPATNVDQILQRRVRDVRGKAVYERDGQGNVVPGARKKGVPLSDVWDIPYLNPKAKERTGYPTQKPLLLLDRIIRIATNQGDYVLDPFCGSGTTLVAANLLGRHAIGIDISEHAIKLTESRLENPVKSESDVFVRGRDAYRNADRAALSCLQGLDYIPVQRNNGIDAILKQHVNGMPVTVRVQRDGEMVLEAAHKLQKASEGKGVDLMFLVATSPREYMPHGDCLPPGVIVVEAPASSIRDHLSKLSQMELR